jgi:hypothetical protein
MVLYILDVKGGAVPCRSNIRSRNLGGNHSQGMIDLGNGNVPPPPPAHARVTLACKVVTSVLFMDWSYGNKARKKQISREEVVEDADRIPKTYLD